MLQSSTIADLKLQIAAAFGAKLNTQLLFIDKAALFPDGAPPRDVQPGDALNARASLLEVGIIDGTTVCVVLTPDCSYGPCVYPEHLMKPCSVDGCKEMSHHLCAIAHYGHNHLDVDGTGDGAGTVRCKLHCRQCQVELERKSPSLLR